MVENAIELLINNPLADSVRGVCQPTQNPFKMWTIKNNGFLEPLHINKYKIHEPYNQARQNLPDIYWQNGYVDITRFNTIVKKKSMTGDTVLPLILESSDIFDIDDYKTFEMAEKHYRKKY